ncbi:hypothetical protein DFH27DRAFT_524096 [Peziza echinospora]|nr:hypothetical protein DFH27DRAFT_524096 [Peziza echinospora]
MPPQPQPQQQQPTQLKWHNTLPQHFSGYQAQKPIVTPGRRAEKRHIQSPDAVQMDQPSRKWGDGAEFGGMAPTLAESAAPSPTKRQRANGRSSNLTTPVKSNSGLNGAGSVKSAGSGMQTPPPSSSSIGKRRGRPPKMAQFSDTPRAAAISPLSSPSTANRYLKHSSQATPAPASGRRASLELSHTLAKGAQNGTKDTATGSDLYPERSSFAEADTSLDWPSFDEETGFPASIGSDMFLHSDMGYHDPSDHMAFSFYNSETENDFRRSTDPSIDPTLLFTSRPTSDASSIFGGYGDDLDVISSSGQADEQPYQHQFNYSRREHALELQRSQRRRLRRKNGDPGYSKKIQEALETGLRRSNSENPLSGSMAASLDEAVKRQAAMHLKGREQTPPPPEKTAPPKTSIQLLISPGGRAKTEARVFYEDSETELDEPTTGSQSLDESMESDSSLDEPIARGLGPGGKPYSAIRRARSAGAFSPRGMAPKLGLFMNESKSNSYSLKGHIETLPRPTTPPRAISTAKPIEGLSSRTTTQGNQNVIHQTPRRHAGRFMDECILSSPKLPTPLRTSPGHHNNRPRIITTSSNYGDLTMDSRLHHRPVLEISDESEAETVVDETLPEDDDDQVSGFGIDEQEEGDALHALRSVVAKRRGTDSEMGRQDELPVKDLFAPTTQAAPIDVLTLKRKALRRRKAIPDGGYGADKNAPQLSGMHTEPMISSSFATIVDPDNASTEEDGDGSLDSEEMIRCSCGTDRDGGTTMIQCDSCNNWLHLKCTGISRKMLPDTYTCRFCTGRLAGLEVVRAHSAGGRLMAGRGSRGGSRKVTPVPGSPTERRVSGGGSLSSPIKRMGEESTRAGSPVRRRLA